MIHAEPHPLAGECVEITKGSLQGNVILIEDWWDRVSGQSWAWCKGNPACLDYAMRTGLSDQEVPSDDEVVYGKVGAFGKLVHVSEIV